MRKRKREREFLRENEERNESDEMNEWERERETERESSVRAWENVRERERRSIEGHEFVIPNDVIYFLARARIHANNVDTFLLLYMLLTSVVASREPRRARLMVPLCARESEC